MASLTPQSRRTLLAVIATTLVVLGVLVAGLTGRLRERLRGEVLQREAEAIHAVASMELGRAEARLSGAAAEILVPQLFAAVLESSRLRGVLAVQLFDAGGALRDALPDVGAITPAARWWPAAPVRPLARYHARASLEAVFGVQVEAGEEPTRAPLLELVVPLQARGGATAVLGAARYWVDGQSVAAEFARLDRELAGQAVLAWLGGAVAVAVVLAWARRRLADAQRRLVAQSEDLARANRELDFAAKTGALGAISAHLIHGLKNPLAGLEGFVADAGQAQHQPGGEAWQDAIATTRRLRAMVQEVAAVLRDEAERDATHAVPVGEFLAEVQARAAPLARAAGVTLSCGTPEGLAMSSRVASFSGLVLANLLTNAIEASRRGGDVSVTAQASGDALEFEVADAAGGLSPAVSAALFQPVASTKRHGGGMGLAISRRLARHAGGDLALVRSDARGTVFRLQVPCWRGETPA